MWSLPRVTTGPEKFWNVLNLDFSEFRTWKVLKLDSGAEKKIMKNCWIWPVPSSPHEKTSWWIGERKVLNFDYVIRMGTLITQWRQKASRWLTLKSDSGCICHLQETWLAGWLHICNTDSQFQRIIPKFVHIIINFMTLFRGWPIMVNDTHTRRRSRST